jgi:hypothetical protein
VSDQEGEGRGIVSETPLPGIGVRYEFVTEDGARLGVIHHRTGVRELVLFELTRSSLPQLGGGKRPSIQASSGRQSSPRGGQMRGSVVRPRQRQLPVVPTSPWVRMPGRPLPGPLSEPNFPRTHHQDSQGQS